MRQPNFREWEYKTFGDREAVVGLFLRSGALGLHRPRPGVADARIGLFWRLGPLDLGGSSHNEFVEAFTAAVQHLE